MVEKKTSAKKLRLKSRFEKQITKVVILVEDSCKRIEKIVMIITESSNKIEEPLLYDIVINNLIHSHNGKKTIEKKL